MGQAHVFGDNVDTDQIIPAQHITTDDPEQLAQYCLAGLDESFADRFETGDVIVAGTNFGSGSSREHAPLAIQGAGAKAVVAESFARIFYRNAINIGLPVLKVEEATASISTGDELTVDVEGGVVENETSGKSLSAAGFPPFIQDIINAGGLIPYGQNQLDNDQ